MAKGNRRRKPPSRPPPRPPPPPPPSPPPPSPPPSSPPPPPLHPILNALPADDRFSVSSSLSRQEMELLAYMITIVMVMESFDPMISSTKEKETLERFTGIRSAHKSPAFGCHCFPCYKTYWERWSSTSSSNRYRIDVALEAFENSLSSWKNGSANSAENSANSCGKNKSRSGVSLPALEEVVEEKSDKEEQETHRSFAGKVLSILFYFFNPLTWILWSPKI